MCRFHNRKIIEALRFKVDGGSDECGINGSEILPGVCEPSVGEEGVAGLDRKGVGIGHDGGLKADGEVHVI